MVVCLLVVGLVFGLVVGLVVFSVVRNVVVVFGAHDAASGDSHLFVNGSKTLSTGQY